MGRPLKYGDIIVLQHYDSELYLSAKRYNSKVGL